MRQTSFRSILAILFALCISCNKPDKQVSELSHGQIFPKGEKISNGNFDGTAHLKMLVSGDSINDITVGNVTFEPGAKTNWHAHPAGQIILATDGLGYYQEKGQAKKILRKGDVVYSGPGIAHWHGAGPDQAFVQLAISSNRKGGAVWLHPVNDEEYSRP